MSMHAHGRRVELYVAVGIAVLALIVAAYAVSQIPKPAPPPKAAANVAKEIVVSSPGTYKISIS